MYKLNILYFVNKNCTFYFIKRDCVCLENYKPTDYNLQSFMKKVTDSADAVPVPNGFEGKVVPVFLKCHRTALSTRLTF